MKYNGPIASLYIGTMEVQCAQIVQIFKKNYCWSNIAFEGCSILKRTYSVLKMLYRFILSEQVSM